MAKKNKLYSVNEKKSSSLILKGGNISLKTENIHEHLQEVKRGCGVSASNKTYNRKKNHRNFDNYDSSFFYNKINIYRFSFCF